jgi:SAM-dependent methyltransferase
MTFAHIIHILQWDVRSWAPAYWLTQHRQHIRFVLELGSRDGGLSLWLAAMGAKVICSDIDGPTPAALDLHRGITSIDYLAIDARAIPYRETFDVIVFKSMLGGCPNQARVIEQIHAALKPGGELWFAENVKASPLHRILRRLNPWSDHWRYPSVSDMRHLLSGFELKYRTTGFLAALGRTERQRDWLARLDQAVFNHIVPESWHYIMFGVARKKYEQF